MRTIVIFTLCCISCLLLTSCGKTHCPAFPEHLVDYFPYNKGDSLSFVNQHNDTLSFCVERGGATKKWSFGSNCKCECDTPSAFLFAIQITKPKWTSIETKISVGGYEKPYISFTLGNGYLDMTTKGYNRLTLFEDTGKDPFDPKNSALFGETVIIEDNDLQISRVVIVKGKGITEFYDQKYDFHWKSINN